MKHVSKAMVFAFQEMLRWHVMKFVLAGGMAATLLWLGIGAMMWDSLIAFGSKIVEMVPFSMVRSNGAWMLATFLWFQITLLSFALFFAFFGNLLLRKVSKERYSFISVAALTFSAFFWGAIFFFKADYIHVRLERVLSWFPYETVEKGIAALIAVYILYNAAIVTMLVISHLFTPALLEEIEIREFREDTVEIDKLVRTFRYTLKDTFLFLAASVLAFPLLFVPVLNVAVQLALWMWLYKDTLTHSASLFVARNEVDEVLRSHRWAMWFLTFAAVMFNFVPVVNFFGPLFGIVAMFYYLRTR